MGEDHRDPDPSSPRTNDQQRRESGKRVEELLVSNLRVWVPDMVNDGKQWEFQEQWGGVRNFGNEDRETVRNTLILTTPFSHTRRHTHTNTINRGRL